MLPLILHLDYSRFFNYLPGNIYLEESSDSEAEDRGEGSFSMLRLDDWANFRAESSLIHLTLQLRQKWSALFLRRLNCPIKQMSQVRKNLLR